MDLFSFFLWIPVLLLVAGALTFWQYHTLRRRYSDWMIPAALRTLAIFGLLLLLVNPKFEQEIRQLVKPNLFVLADNSESIKHLKQGTTLRNIRSKLLVHPQLNEKYTVRPVNFGYEISNDTTLSYTSEQTNIGYSLYSIDQLSLEKGPVVLLTDGNQTTGRPYQFQSTRLKIYPLIIGDTTQLDDLKITLVNHNNYVGAGKQFPVEVYVNYRGKKEVQPVLELYDKKGLLQQKTLNLGPESKSNSVTFKIASQEIGRQLFDLKLTHLEREETYLNNSYTFGVDVLDQKSEVAIYYSRPHPDIGMLKRSIESDEQKEVVLIPIDDFSRDTDRYATRILYQPDRNFNELIEHINKLSASYLIISGTGTDWQFLNSKFNWINKSSSGVEESANPVFNQNFDPFFVDDLPFDTWPPLKNQLGRTVTDNDVKVLFNQRIQGIETDEPLFLFRQDLDQRIGVLLGEGLWKWRLYHYSKQQNFESFDQFVMSVVRYLSLSGERSRVELIYDPVYYANEAVKIRVKKYNANLEPDLNADMYIQLDDQPLRIPLILNKDSYLVSLSDLSDGTHTFRISSDDGSVNERGSFKVIAYSLEKSVSSSNYADMLDLAKRESTQLYNEKNADQLIIELIDNEEYRIIEKFQTKNKSLIDWKWLLALIILSLSVEWGLRKYRGWI